MYQGSKAMWRSKNLFTTDKNIQKPNYLRVENIGEIGYYNIIPNTFKRWCDFFLSLKTVNVIYNDYNQQLRRNAIDNTQ